MENIPTVSHYLWQRLPLMIMFVNGYLIYRLLVVTDLTEVFVFRVLQYCRNNIGLLFFFIIVASALLSFFIPNTITVLTLLPVLKTIDTDIGVQTGHRLTTALTLSVIYGANIGGMGSLIGSPANLLLIGELDLYAVPGRYQISFFNWFLWSVPLVAFLIIAAWGVIAFGAVPHGLRGARFRIGKSVCETDLTGAQRRGGSMFAVFLLFWSSDALLREIFPGFAVYEPAVCIGFFGCFCRMAFYGKDPMGNGPLLRLADLVRDFPRRGILFLGLLVALILAARLFHADRQVSDIFLKMVDGQTSRFGVIFITVTTVIFLTELFSNTVVSTAFFPVAYFTSADHGISPLILMIAVSVASTCAFMTPVATPCNALAFGEMKGTSLGRMIVLGIILNGFTALVMSAWLQFAVPRVYG
ncbi:sodium:sulfate symporter [Desulfonema ishimotonii]|uniref:Sodium:sulfate symporter n=1 Tax=Desulfonema ishimotonii TaxID=45657 RepID=A0A401FSB2_9BACT|nr:SLC13 family permease [Desulfonema ishimotonii]GBC59862.1 sodium:sulfate symporter [Desulfonema ishimotonii]